jgi:hypothetical protein
VTAAPGPPAAPCPTCGALHLDLATAMGSGSPHAWDVATAAQRDAGELTDDLCFLPEAGPEGGTSYFLRGEVALPLLDGGDRPAFSWSVWVLVSGESLEVLFEHWDEPDRAERVPPVYGLLASALPYEPSTLDLRAVVRTRAPGLVPRVEVERGGPSPHPLAREQAEGISWHRVAELNAAVYGELH